MPMCFNMDSSQLIPEDMLAATLLATPVSTSVPGEIIADSDQASQNLQDPSAGSHITPQESIVDGDDIINIEPGQSLIQANGENYWVSSQIQYVVIQRDDQGNITDIKTESKTPLSNHESANKKGTDKLQCGLCDEILYSVTQFLHHKATHVARGMGLGCEVCGLSFSRKLALTEHYRRKHRISLVEKKSEDCVQKHVKYKKNSNKTQRVDTQFDQDSETYEQVGEVLEDGEKERNEMANEMSQVVMETKQTKDESFDVISQVAENEPFDCLSVTNEVRMEGNATAVTEQLPYTFGSTSAESNVETHNLDLQNDNQMETNTSVADLQKANVLEAHANEESVSIMNEIDVTTSMKDNQQEICQLEMLDMGNSNSSEKENAKLNCDSSQEFTNKKLVDSASENMVKLSKTIKELSVELNMPDFHFIPVIGKSKKGHIQGGKYSFKCLYCDLKVCWRSTLCRHMREKHADILKVGSLLNIPAIKGDNEVMTMSEYIKMETRSSAKRIRGVETQDLPGDFLCDKCDKIFHRLRYLRKHQTVHKMEKNLLCSVCVKSFRTVANLNQHMKTHKDREAYKCSQCDFQSSVNIAIHTHRQIHSKGCVLCEICGSAYSDKSTLTKHKQVHNPLRPFACTYPGCTWRFKTKAMCGAHYRAHTSKGQYECNICGYAFRQKHHLQRHEKTVHNIVPQRRPTFNYLEPATLHYSRDEAGNRLDACNNVQEVSLVINEANEVSVDTVDDQFDLESALQAGQLVIATEDGNTINYEMSDIGMNMSYQTLLQDGDGNQLDAHTILIPQSDGSYNVYQQEEITETVSTEEEATEK